jgi:hypothetical protein
MKKKVILVICLFANPWIWKIFTHAPLMALALILLSIFLIFRIKFLAILFFIVLSIFLIKTNFNSNIFHPSSIEMVVLRNRFNIYAQSLGQIYRNRFGLYFHYTIAPPIAKFYTNLGYNMDPNLYFFANHPRERATASEFEKFSFLLLPVFILGAITIFSGRHIFLIVYCIFSLLVSAIISPGFELGPILIFPFIVAMLYLGFLKISTKFT